MEKNEKPDWRDVHNEAWELKKRGKFKKAIETYFKAIEIHPNHTSYHNLGETYAAMGDREKAIFYFDKSLELHPEYALAYNNKAFSLYVLRKYDLALESINKALQYKKKDAIIHATKAEILFALKEKEEFYKSFETAVYLGVDPTILDSNIKRKYGKEKRYKIIVGDFEEVEINSPILKEICNKIETWDAVQIKEAISLLKTNKEFSRTIEDRYGQIYKNLGGKTLRSLADFSTKWEKLNNTKKCNILTYWPISTPFPTANLDLSGEKRVDRWRDSHYTKQIENFPPNLTKIKGIREVYLKHQQLKEVPDFVYEMKDLEVLDMRDNEFRGVESKLLELKKLKSINLNYNYSLKRIPNLGELKNLEELFLQYTKIDFLLDEFFMLKNLKKLDVSNSTLDKKTAIIQRIITSFPDLELESHAKKAILAEGFTDPDKYKGQEKIRYREFYINYLPENLFLADVVKELEIDCHHLKELPNTFDKLPTLEILKINIGSDISSLPSSITELKSLKELHIEGWKITTLPENLGSLIKLEKLHLKCNNLEHIPNAVYNMQSLTELEINGSRTVHILSAITGLQNLKTLKLKDIFELSIDPAIKELSNLEKVNINIRNIEHFKGFYSFPNTLKEFTFRYIKRRTAEPSFEVSFGKFLNQLPNIEKLELRGVSIHADAHDIIENKTLRELFIDGGIKILPKGFGNLKMLRNITIFNSKMETLAPSFYECSNLQYSRINDALFTSIPEGISKLQKLVSFGFETSPITSLPEDIYELQQLERLVLGESPLFKDKSFKAKIKRKIKGLKVDKSWY
ncbi:leucine-rich repeat domain-containing protein [Kordia sp.]|uniref:leucine-rich repeat domain-containing protein n=1 Tax=Kordia sp. TaxID=1965332 RepID=UPI003B5989C8